MKINLSRSANRIIVIAFVITLMVVAKTILVPIFIAVIFSLLLYPIAHLLDNWNFPRLISVIITLLVFVGIIVGIILFFSAQMYALFDNINAFRENLNALFERIIDFINTNISYQDITKNDLFRTERNNIISSSTNIIGAIISSSSAFLAYAAFTLIYTFLFLLYRTSFKSFILSIYAEEKQGKIRRLLEDISKLAQKYFFGLFITIMIVGTLNGLGLFLIGLDYPFLFGFFAALLTIVPYIGTTVGGLLPFLYALVFYDSIWMPVGVALLYMAIQAIEGNILTPKIVGASVELNPLVAILSLIIGGVIWGVPGLILFIPMVAIIKLIMESDPNLKRYAILLSSEFPHKKFNQKKVKKDKKAKNQS